MSNTLEGRTESQTRPASGRRELSTGTLIRIAARPGVRLVVWALMPAMLAVWLVPGFITQDGSAHLYNSAVMRDLIGKGSASPYARELTLRLQPFPNWAGHLCAMLLMTIFPAWVVGQLMATATLAGVAAAAMWLRKRVLGLRHPYVGALAIAVIATNFPWLLGFWSFLLGVIVCLVTWGLVWGQTNAPMPTWDRRRGIQVSALLIAGYFCHPVSLSVTVGGLVLVALSAPRFDRRTHLSWTGLVTLPLVPLLAWYGWTTRGQGGIQLVYENLRPVLSPAGWLNQLRWVDPVTLGSRQALPFLPGSAAWYVLISPLAALGLAFYLAWASRWYGSKALVLPLSLSLRPVSKGTKVAPERSLWPWWALVVALLLMGVVAPDTLGPAHGNYLPQRFLLMGLLTAAVVFDVSWATLAARRYAWLCLAALTWALLLQTGFVWDYALHCRRVAWSLVESSRAEVGRNQRVAALWIDTDRDSKFRANPLLHADTLLGIGTGNLVWSDYELAHYYFPIRLRSGVTHPPAGEFEAIGKLQGPTRALQRRIRWRHLLDACAESVDRLVTRGADPALDAITAERFTLVFESADEVPVRVWKRSAKSISLPQLLP